MTAPVLIMGANGFIGRALTQALSTSGQSVIAVSRSTPHGTTPNVEYVTGDLTTPASLRPLVARCRAVVHLATTSTPGTSAARALNEVQTNLHFTATLLETLQEHPQVELLYFSSGGSLYGDDPSTGPSTESSPVRPHSYHGAAKLASEAFIQAWVAQNDSKATVLRPSNVYGPGQPERPGFGIIPAAMGHLLRDEPLSIWGDGEVRRDYVFIDDVVRLAVRILFHEMPRSCRIFNVCSESSISLNTLLAAIEVVAGKPLRRTYEKGRTVDASCIAMSSAAAAEAYGWQHQTSLQDGLRATWHHLMSDQRA